MRFGEYIKHKREALGLTQSELVGFNQSYIADIENGRIYPSKHVTIEKLARSLHFDLSERGINFLRTYSMLDTNPVEYFGAGHLSRSTGNTTIIQIGDTEAAVLKKFGEPDRRIEVPATKSKWIYRAEDVHIIFVNGRVNEVVFK